MLKMADSQRYRQFILLTPQNMRYILYFLFSILIGILIFLKIFYIIYLDTQMYVLLLLIYIGSSRSVWIRCDEYYILKSNALTWGFRNISD